MLRMIKSQVSKMLISQQPQEKTNASSYSNYLKKNYLYCEF